MQKIIEINGSNLTIEDVVAVARYGIKVKLDEKQKDKILESRKYVEDALFNKIPIYGINTGFGKFENIPISEEELELLQKNYKNDMKKIQELKEKFAEEIEKNIENVKFNSRI